MEANYYLFCLQHNADVKLTDHEGRTCISYINYSSNLQSDSNNANVSILRNLLLNSGCPDTSNLNGKSNNCAGTLSSKQTNYLPPLDKLQSSVI